MTTTTLKSALKISLAVLTAAGLALVVTGCSPECVDKYDCQNSNTTLAKDVVWSCVNNKCQKTAAQVTDAGQ